MKPLTIGDAATMVLGLQDEIRRSEESRYDHRLHGVLLVAQGLTRGQPAFGRCPTHGRSSNHAALRALAFKWLRILYRCWQNRTLYDERLHLKALARRGSPLRLTMPMPKN